ncbi:MAG: NifB/NifX family molybdenum-iron cluster-binding protein [Candidatus Eisenbacteria bacterium]|uniref:NifB/NifX family molybdenum-iron cluster-binding protein n=1 Tax=Eiseniibacteriota bacterium TaxID=2212470 RepID=A0A948RX47_UNCEI|nr:NifB/NifX family molybdenum-iron cluster-binding protein [Candidatus Eisenbacteria bacterium]MBU1949747.1 NifB/NifX family molybdenum-iron cluster-binding protein [Candidatus Eisenbacteria bacterium]MBU2691576.1 NifB/NifX family molybdenum-iron cluster-binding protein [Candidatus Eisenbacteria bacterium]
MSIAFTTQGTEWDSSMDPRFGRTRFFFVFDEKTEKIETFDNSAIEKESHGAGPKAAQKLVELGANVLITGNGPGGNAAAVLESTGIKVFVGAGEMTVKEALEAYRCGKLKEF